MKKKILSLMLAFIMLLGILPSGIVFAEEMSEISVYFTLSLYDELAKDKDGSYIAQREIKLEGKQSYNLDDVFKKAHEELYPDGIDGYSSSVGMYGSLSIDKLWGDESGNFIYYQNTESAWSLEDEVTDGAYIDACVLKNHISEMESYSYFDIRKSTFINSGELTLNLELNGYDDSWNPIRVSVPGATIIINGEETDIVTDESGSATLSFTELGEYVVSAKKDKESIRQGHVGELIPSITPPALVVTVKDPPEIEIIHNIAKGYKNSDLTQTGGNFPLILADMAVYEELYPESEFILSEEEKKIYLDKLISDAQSFETPADLSKAIIAFSALGYDAKNVTNNNFQKIDAVKKLTDLIDAKDERVTDIYKLPYVIIALSNVRTSEDAERTEYLVASALSSKNEWILTDFGTDGMTPMILALSEFYDKDGVAAAVDAAIEILKAEQRQDGLIDGFPGYESASTGLALCAFASLGMDAKEITNGGKNLIEGLLSCATEGLSGFDNAFSNEQGFRGLLAWQLNKTKSRTIYDFSGYEKEEAYQTPVENAPVIFDVTPVDALVKIENKTQSEKNLYDLEEGTYTYTVSKSGYITQSGSFAITAEEALLHTPKTISVSLSKSSGGSNVSDDKIGVGIKVLVHDEKLCNNSYSYKNDKNKYTSLISKTIKLEKNSTVYDALVTLLNNNDISYEERDGYISSIDGISEFDHGAKSGWMFIVNGKEVLTPANETILKASDSVVWFYTDDYTLERGTTEDVAGEKTGEREEKPEEKNTAKDVFSDIDEEAWYYPAVEYVWENGIFAGTDKGFEPNKKMSRAMIVSVLYRLSGVNGEFENSFLDVPDGAWYTDAVVWANANGIISGMDKNYFAPDADLTREQLAVIIYRYVLSKEIEILKNDATIEKYSDYDKISDYAIEALDFMVKTGLMSGKSSDTINPKDTTTRAEVAMIIANFLKNVK